MDMQLSVQESIEIGQALNLANDLVLRQYQLTDCKIDLSDTLKARLELATEFYLKVIRSVKNEQLSIKNKCSDIAKKAIFEGEKQRSAKPNHHQPNKLIEV